MAIHGLCRATNIRKYDWKFFFLTFKCYCFHQTSCVSVHSRSRHIWQMAEERCLGGLLFFGPHRAASWTNHKRINNWVSHPKHWVVGVIKNFMACHYVSAPTTRATQHSTSIVVSVEPSLRSFVCPKILLKFHFSWLKHLESTQNIGFVSNIWTIIINALLPVSSNMIQVIRH